VGWFTKYAADHQATKYREIADKFKNLPRTLAPPVSIYGWLKQFQDGLLDIQEDAHPSPSGRSKGKGKDSGSGSGASPVGKYRPGSSSKHTGRKLLLELAKAGSDKIHHKRDGQHEWVIVMLQAAHDFVAGRQRDLAEAILRSRHAEVARWELQLRRPSGTDGWQGGQN